MSSKVPSSPTHSRTLQVWVYPTMPQGLSLVVIYQWEEHHLQEVIQASVAAWDTRAMLVSQEPQLHDTDPGLKICL